MFFCSILVRVGSIRLVLCCVVSSCLVSIFSLYFFYFLSVLFRFFFFDLFCSVLVVFPLRLVLVCSVLYVGSVFGASAAAATTAGPGGGEEVRLERGGGVSPPPFRYFSPYDAFQCVRVRFATRRKELWSCAASMGGHMNGWVGWWVGG